MNPPPSVSKVSLQVSLNAELVPAASARVSPLSDGFMYGYGVFETIKVIRGRPAFFREHVARLNRGAVELGLPETVQALLRERVDALIAANHLGHGVLKIVIFQDENAAGELLTTREGLYPADTYARGFRLKSVPVAGRDSRLTALKSMNYLANLRAKREATVAGFDEPLFVDAAGFALEGATTNVFAVSGRRVLTPALARGLLPGIARASVLALAGAHTIAEADLSLEQLLRADEVFVTNSLLGVMPVSAIDAKIYDVTRNPITRDVQAAFAESEHASLG